MAAESKKGVFDPYLCILVFVIIIMIVAGQWSVWVGHPPGARLVKMVEVGAAMLAASGVMLATYISYVQARGSDRRISEESARRKLEETFRLIERWDDPHFLSARKLSVELGRQSDKMSPEQLVEHVASNQELRSSISLMMNYFDFVRLSIKYDRIDGSIIKGQLGHVANVTLDRFGPWIKKLGPVYEGDIAEFKRMMM